MYYYDYQVECLAIIELTKAESPMAIVLVESGFASMK